MAKVKKAGSAASVAVGGSVPTGYFVPCLMNTMRKPVIHRRPIALPVQQGPKKCWVSCSCGFFAYLPRAWQRSWGMSESDAERAGFLVLTSV